MNKLEEYREAKYREFIDNEGNYDAEQDEFFFAGFDAALSLDLPVKFAEWQNSLRYLGEIHSNALPDKDVSSMTFEELYKYWLENIFKPE